MTGDTEGAVAILIPRERFSGAALLAVLDRLRLHGASVVVASHAPGRCEGTDDVHVTANVGFEDPALGRSIAYLILDAPGGRMAGDPAFARLLLAARRERKVLAAIGHGVAALAAAGVVHGFQVTAPDELAEAIARQGGEVLRETVVIDRGLITSTEAGAGELAEELFGFGGVRFSPTAPMHE